mmetsp:Transcript_26196/g.30289  ORF Transcript_26196/g.30289 Transcript_26196/m.30289 type:complete len:97 (+) Transcript_26196:336-626(+)
MGPFTYDVFKHSLLFKSGKIKKTNCSVELKSDFQSPFNAEALLNEYLDDSAKKTKEDKEGKAKKGKNKQGCKLVPQNVLLSYDYKNLKLSMDYKLN